MTIAFQTKPLPENPDAIAPDGAEVRILLSLPRGSMAHFQLAPGLTSRAVCHRTVEEVWFFLAGRGEMWRKLGTQEEVVPVSSGLCITIPLGTHFQFRNTSHQHLAAVGVTMPPWPGPDEAFPVEGPWPGTADDSGSE